MIKGSNRRMFRKPGRARQAIGILASSKELMDAAQGSQMPMQPVQSFAGGGLANNYLFNVLGIEPAGLRRVGEGDDATLEPVPGFSGAYQRLSGIADPARARQQSGMDLLELGARIAAGQSTSATENIAAGLVPTLEGIGKRRQQELANTLAIAQLEDTRKKREEALATAALDRKLKLLKPYEDALAVTGYMIDDQTGDILGKGGARFSNITELTESEGFDSTNFATALNQSRDAEYERVFLAPMNNKDVSFDVAMSQGAAYLKVKNEKLGTDRDALLELLVPIARKKAEQQGLIFRDGVRDDDGYYIIGQEPRFEDPKTKDEFDVFGNKIRALKID